MVVIQIGGGTGGAEQIGSTRFNCDFACVQFGFQASGLMGSAGEGFEASAGLWIDCVASDWG